MNNNLKNILLGITTALLFSAFIYFEEFNLTFKLVNTIFGISALALFLYIPKRAVLIAGFLIGFLWFYWIGYSFKYQGVAYMTPIVTLGFGFIYMLFFGTLAVTNKVYLRAILLFSLSFFEPFDWNWLQIEVLFVDSYIGLFKYQLALVLFALTLPKYVTNNLKYYPLLIILLALNFSAPTQIESKLKIMLASTNIKQDYKWTREALNPTIKLLFSKIDKAISQKYDLIVLPESAFPLYMNKNQALKNALLEKSEKISIVVGSLLKENGNLYNVSYLFDDREYKVAKKMVLVPFGEYIPLPKFAQEFINNTFFSGSSDFIGANAPTDFVIKGEVFRNAICYEATCSEIYEGELSFVIAISNNAWFEPSIEPTIQKLLMRYYARKNGVTIYHSANVSGTGVIK